MGLGRDRGDASNAAANRAAPTAPIYCTETTKQMLLDYEPERSRRARIVNKAERRVLPCEHLCDPKMRKYSRQGIRVPTAQQGVDHLHSIPYNTPTTIHYTSRVDLVITLLDANHMPGSAMFLIEGPRGAVLHTGDVRAEEWWVEALARNVFINRYIHRGLDEEPEFQPEVETQVIGTSPSRKRTSSGALQPFEPPRKLHKLGAVSSKRTWRQHTEMIPSDMQRMHPPVLHNIESTQSSSGVSSQDSETELSANWDLRLFNIYFDSEMVGAPDKAVSKLDAVKDMTRFLRAYPPDTVFYLNSWTWGYEEMLKGAAKAVGSQIHVDPYKWLQYTRNGITSDRFLPDVLTSDESTRLHACEKGLMCETLQKLGATAHGWSKGQGQALEAALQDPSAGSHQVVYVHPVEWSQKSWGQYHSFLLDRLAQARQNRNQSWPPCILVPLARHSPLPELQSLVRLFRPRMITPNNISTEGYFLLPKLFAGCLDPHALEELAFEVEHKLGFQCKRSYEKKYDRFKRDKQRQNEGTPLAEDAIAKDFMVEVLLKGEAREIQEHTLPEVEAVKAEILLWRQGIQTATPSTGAGAVSGHRGQPTLPEPLEQVDPLPIATQAALGLSQTSVPPSTRDSQSVSQSLPPVELSHGIATALVAIAEQHFRIPLASYGCRDSTVANDLEAWQLLRLRAPHEAEKVEELRFPGRARPWAADLHPDPAATPQPTPTPTPAHSSMPTPIPTSTQQVTTSSSSAALTGAIPLESTMMALNEHELQGSKEPSTTIADSLEVRYPAIATAMSLMQQESIKWRSVKKQFSDYQPLVHLHALFQHLVAEIGGKEFQQSLFTHQRSLLRAVLATIDTLLKDFDLLQQSSTLIENLKMRAHAIVLVDSCNYATSILGILLCAKRLIRQAKNLSSAESTMSLWEMSTMALQQLKLVSDPDKLKSLMKHLDLVEFTEIKLKHLHVRIDFILSL